MGTRVKTFDSTGVAPNGRLFAGDLNSIQDQYADLNNLAQALGIGTLQIGEAGLQLLRYGPSEARISGHVRADGIVRALGGLYSGAYTTAQRDAISAGYRPYGLVILNTTTNRLEINLGTDPAPSWQAMGAQITQGALGSRPGASAGNANSWYFATDDNGGTLYFSNGSSWTKVSKGLTEAPVGHQASHQSGGSDALPWGTIIGSGTLSARPAASAVNTGYLYFASDDTGGTLYRSTGAAWVKIAVPLADPTLTNSRTPTAHHTTHEPGGSDPLNFTVVNLQGPISGRPAASSYPGQFYFATDQAGGTLYQSVGGSWVQVALGVTQAPAIADGSLTPAKIAGTAVINSDSRLSDQRTPLDNSVTSAKIADGTIQAADLAGGAALANIGAAGITSPYIANGTIDGTQKMQAGTITNGAAIGTGFPTSGLFTGYLYTLYQTQGNGYCLQQFCYRPDLDGTYPWHFIGGGDMTAAVSGNAPSDGGYGWYNLNGGTTAVNRGGQYHVFGWGYGGASNGGGGVAVRIASSNGNTQAGVGWGNNAHQAFNGIFWALAAGNYIYMQGNSSVNGAWYSGNVGCRPIRVG